MARILIIEDEDEVRSNLRILLKMYNHEVLEAASGKEGVEAAMHEIPDLILCDINMPEMSGIQVIKVLQGNPDTFAIPFLFLTAHANKDSFREGMDLGADDYLTKPFTINELIKAVDARLKKSVIHEITANKKIENLRKNISLAIPHELRTPLNSILGFSRILIDEHKEFDDAELVSMYENIHDSGKRLLRIINNYIYYNTLVTSSPKDQRPEEYEYDIRPVIDEVIQEFYFKYDISDLKINLDEFAIRINEEQFRKAMFELIDNTFKFSSATSNVEIKGEINSDNYTLTFINPVERKININIEEIGAFNQIGREFYEQQGAGLGLAIVKLTAELNKFDFKIYSDDNFFTVELKFHF